MRARSWSSNFYQYRVREQLGRNRRDTMKQTLVKPNANPGKTAAELPAKGRTREPLRLGEHDTSSEREAQQVAGRVTTGQAMRRALTTPPLVQPRVIGAARPLGEAAVALERELTRPGLGLDTRVRGQLEPRFGHSFAQVRIHTDTDAAKSARQIGARAYTAGQHIVFGAGHYAPHTPVGKRLLAHELAHTLQQAGSPTPAVVQREPETPAAPPPAEAETAVERKDLVFIMDTTFISAARLFSPGAQIIEVHSPEAMVEALGKVKSPLRTVFVMAHSRANADIAFNATDWVSADTLAGALTGAVDPTKAPQALDFRGCSIGMSPTGMEKLRQAMGAGSVVGSSCYMYIFRSHSVQLNGTPITRSSQLKTSRYKRAFDLHFKSLPEQFGKASECIINRTKKGYFQAGGHLVSVFTDKDYKKRPPIPYSEETSVCYQDLTTTTVNPKQVAEGKLPASSGCRLLKIDIAAPEAAPVPEAEAKAEATPETEDSGGSLPDHPVPLEDTEESTSP